MTRRAASPASGAFDAAVRQAASILGNPDENWPRLREEVLQGELCGLTSIEKPMARARALACLVGATSASVTDGRAHRAATPPGGDPIRSTWDIVVDLTTCSGLSRYIVEFKPYGAPAQWSVVARGKWSSHLIGQLCRAPHNLSVCEQDWMRSATEEEAIAAGAPFKTREGLNQICLPQVAIRNTRYPGSVPVLLADDPELRRLDYIGYGLKPNNLDSVECRDAAQALISLISSPSPTPAITGADRTRILRAVVALTWRTPWDAVSEPLAGSIEAFLGELASTA